MLSALEELRRIRRTTIPVSRQPILAPTKPTKVEMPLVPEAICSCSETAFDPAASAVLGILVHASQPVLHTAIVAAMVLKGFDKVTAKRAIASCQAKRWIEHNLVGYILAEEGRAIE